jgi:hypothetical protein
MLVHVVQGLVDAREQLRGNPDKFSGLGHIAREPLTAV